MISTDAAEHNENWRRLTETIDLAVKWATMDGPPAIDTTGGGTPVEWDSPKDQMIEQLGRRSTLPVFNAAKYRAQNLPLFS